MVRGTVVLGTMVLLLVKVSQVARGLDLAEVPVPAGQVTADLVLPEAPARVVPACAGPWGWGAGEGWGRVRGACFRKTPKWPV